MRVTYIYALIDPRSDEVRYVGKTVKNPEWRRREHVREAVRGTRKDAPNSRKNRWIRCLLRENLEPKLQVIEKVLSESDWSDRERYWIAFGRANGWRLTNSTDGGEGTLGFKIENPSRIAFPDEAISLMGKISDGEIARKFNLDHNTVQYRRVKLGIPSCESCRKHIRISLPDECIRQLGTVCDEYLAKFYGVSPQTIRRKREEMGIKRFPTGEEWRENPKIRDEIALLAGTMPDSSLAEKCGVGRSVIADYRKRQGIPAYKKEFPSEMIAQIGKVADYILGKQYGFTPKTIRQYRDVNGIINPSSKRVKVN